MSQRRVTFEVTISIPEVANDFQAKLILEGALTASANHLQPSITIKKENKS